MAVGHVYAKLYQKSKLKRVFKVPDLVNIEDLLKILPREVDKDKVRLAYRFASVMHDGQRRGSGEPFIHHPLAVAYLVAKLRLDEDTIIAALLHDVIEDNTVGVSIDVINRYFGKTVAFLVDSLTNFREVSHRFIGHKDSVEDLRKLLAASIDDVRVLILRLSDKVHNAWTYYGLPEDKKIRLAKRALSIYAPLAHFVGLHMYKRELEEVAFHILYPEIFDWLSSRMSYLYDINMGTIIVAIKRVIHKNSSYKGRIKITARRKSLWSTYQKILRYLRDEGRYEDVMRRPLEEQLYIFDETLTRIYDKLGVMILTEYKEDIYKILESLHRHFEFIPEEFDDYIKCPKETGYRAIHTVLNLNKNKRKTKPLWVEVQLKTFKMHQFNEYGPASHIAYKYGGQSEDYKWVRDLVAWTKDRSRYKLKLFEKFVFVFTPQGEIIKMPKGATALDLLYKIKKGALFNLLKVIVNGKEVPFDYVLKTGDLVAYLIDPLEEIPTPDLYKYAALEDTRRFLKLAVKQEPIFLEKVARQS